jgi:hypothetical protein
MPVQLSQVIGDDELMSRSVMDEPRSGFQKLQDFLVGRSPSERMTSGLTSLTPLRVGVKPGMEKMASQLTRRGLRGPWFHGTPHPRNIVGDVSLELPGGFDPQTIGLKTGTRLGEPAGISLTRDPCAASTFGDVLRVGVDVPPSSVGQFVDPEVQRLFRAAYEKATLTDTKPPFPFVVPGGPSRNIREANQTMSDYLRSQGLEAIQYNPRRWAEHELRVLDPAKAVPLGQMPKLTSPIGKRYYLGLRDKETFVPNGSPFGGLREKLARDYMAAPEFPSRLKDVLLGASD